MPERINGYGWVWSWSVLDEFGEFAFGVALAVGFVLGCVPLVFDAPDSQADVLAAALDFGDMVADVIGCDPYQSGDLAGSWIMDAGRQAGSFAGPAVVLAFD